MSVKSLRIIPVPSPSRVHRDGSQRAGGTRHGARRAEPGRREELLALPHLNATLVKGIMERRPFLSMTELNTFLSQSLSQQQRTELYGRMFIHLNLNTASKEEILLIPGVGNRMLHEFEEYRPYKTLAQFHREIDKYVDDKELARLEQYVFVPISLNTASDADILTIPGMGQRMLHEFKEYRPYQDHRAFLARLENPSTKEVASWSATDAELN